MYLLWGNNIKNKQVCWSLLQKLYELLIYYTFFEHSGFLLLFIYPLKKCMLNLKMHTYLWFDWPVSLATISPPYRLAVLKGFGIGALGNRRTSRLDSFRATCTVSGSSNICIKLCGGVICLLITNHFKLQYKLVLMCRQYFIIPSFDL